MHLRSSSDTMRPALKWVRAFDSVDKMVGPVARVWRGLPLKSGGNPFSQAVPQREDWSNENKFTLPR
ncbi:MAG TPA: hypothetical protein VMV10_06615, partial [Pirellulales bacterium]|nr:hypothetical protein [Pirellulales bacterium]